MSEPAHRDPWTIERNVIFDSQPARGPVLELRLLRDTVESLNAWCTWRGIQVAVNVEYHVDSDTEVVRAHPLGADVRSSYIFVARSTYFTHKRLHRARRLNERMRSCDSGS